MAELIDLPYSHNEEGYSSLSLYQQILLSNVTPHVTNAARSMSEKCEDASFTVVDYGAADGLNSIPLIAACSEELSSKVSDFHWTFNDLSYFDTIHKVQDQLNKLPEWKKGLVKLTQFVGNFYTQVVPDNSVNLGVSVTAVHWLSRRPPSGCNRDHRYPDETTHDISANDWASFLQYRAKELKKGGRLVIALPICPSVVTERESIFMAPQRVIKDMFDEDLITEEEYNFASILPYSWRAKTDLQAPFLDPCSDLGQLLRLIDIKTIDIPCPFYQKWMKSDGGKNSSATQEFVTQHVNFIKSFSNTFWTILECTRSKAVHLAILDTFYNRIEDMVQRNVEGYQADVCLAVVHIERS